MKQTTDHNQGMSKTPDESYDIGWLSKTQTNVHGGSLSKKYCERFDFGILSTKHTTDHHRCLSKTRQNCYEYGWILMKQTGDHKEGMSKKSNEWYDLAWISMKQTTDQKESVYKNRNKRYIFWRISAKQTNECGRWRSMKQLNEIILEVDRWQKRLSKMEVYPKNQRKKRSWMLISETNHWLGRQYNQKTKWRLYSWLVNNEQTTDHDGCTPMNPHDLYGQG